MIIIIIASLHSRYEFLYPRGATLSVSSQRYIEHILDLNHTTGLSHLVSTKPVERFYGLRGKNTHLKGNIFVFICF